jgi:hypothetical protein
MDTSEYTAAADESTDSIAKVEPTSAGGSPAQRRGCSCIVGSLILLGCAVVVGTGLVSVYDRQMQDVKAKSAMRNAFQIWVGLNAYANNNEKVFPSESPEGGEATTSNDALRNLFVRDWVDDEKLFYVAGSAWHGGKVPDNEKGTAAANFPSALGPGENHWGYVKNLTMDRDDTTQPILMDGGIPGQPCRWTDDPSLPGGLGRGKTVVVVRIGGSAKVMNLEKVPGSVPSVFSVMDSTREGKELFPENNRRDALNPTPPVKK